MASAKRFTLHAAVYLLLIRAGKVLLIRRFNTGWRDGEYTLPAGHVDGNATLRSELCREAMEEVGVTVKPSDLQFVHVMHHRDTREYVDFYFATKIWSGEPANCEPEKCDDLRWVALNRLPANVIPNVKQALAACAANEGYSEIGWS